VTLAGRVSTFFLVAPAVALAGYSAIFFYVARSYLYEQFDARLQTAVDLLAASIEVEDDDAKWQPDEHGIALDHDVLAEARWIVTDERGQVIDRYPALSRDDPRDGALFAYASARHPDGDLPADVGDWRVLQRQLDAPRPKPIGEREPHEFAALRITVARSPRGLEDAIHALAIAVVALPATVWAIAAAAGRWYVGRAIGPVRAMAAAAREAERAGFDLHIPVAEPRDELAELGIAFNHVLDRLRDAYERQRRFTGDAAHQLRTPLAVLRGEIDVARRRERPVPEYVKTLAILGQQAEALSATVEALLFLARADADRIPVQTEPIDLDA